MNKMESDLEKMNKDRRKAEEEYLASQEQQLEMQRIEKEGILGVDDLVTYCIAVIEDVKHSEDIARVSNNSIIYSEAIGIRREFSKLLNLVFKVEAEDSPTEGTEEAHRANNDGQEGYQ